MVEPSVEAVFPGQPTTSFRSGTNAHQRLLQYRRRLGADIGYYFGRTTLATTAAQRVQALSLIIITMGLAALNDPRVVVALLGIGVAIVLFLIGQWWWRRKSIAYTAEITPVLSVHEVLMPTFQIVLADGTAAENVNLAVITLWNSGYEPIKSDDFDRAIRFRFGDKAQILNLGFHKCRPEDLEPSFSLGELVDVKGKLSLEGESIMFKPDAPLPLNNWIDLNPLLLNRGDGFSFWALVPHG